MFFRRSFFSKKKKLILLPLNSKRETVLSKKTERNTTAEKTDSNYRIETTKKETVNETVSLMPDYLKKEKKAIKTNASPKLKRSSSGSFSGSISIRPKIKTKEEVKVEEEESSYRPTKTFTSERYKEVLQAFRIQLKEKGKDSLASIFDSLPAIKNNIILLFVENKALEDEFLANKSDFITYVRKELENFDIQVETKINKDTTLKKAYTPQEKFIKMSTKNPNLNDLVKKLDMDIGYA